MINFLTSRFFYYTLGVLCVALVGWVFIGHRGEVSVNIVVIPTDSRLQIDGKNANAGNHYLKVGRHNLRVSHQYFDDTVKEVDISKATNSQPIYMSAQANSPAAQNWLKNHPQDQLLRDFLGSLNYDRYMQTINNKAPLVSSLPVHDYFFTIDYRRSTVQPGNLPAIYIRASSVDGRAQAIEWIKDKGYDPSNYEIIFESDNNPLGETQ